MMIYIEEGFLEGNLHSKKMRKMLRSHGHTITPSAQKADLIIAHSAGWCFIPDLKEYQRLILLDPAFDNGKSLFLRSCERGIHDLRHLRASMIFERILNVWYLFRLMPRWLRLRTLIHSRPITPLLARDYTFVVGVIGSSWWDESAMIKADVPHEMITGDHDIFWSHPRRILSFI